MAYITPRVKIAQEFTQVPSSAITPLPAFIMGPNYHLARYSEDSEKGLTAVSTSNGVAVADGNAYNSTADTTYDFPDVPTGGVVDAAYTKLFLDNVQAKYFPLTSLGSTAVGANVVTLAKLTDSVKYTNRLRFSDAVLRTSPASVRSSYFSGRDVKVGDYIEVTGSDNKVIRAAITGFFADNYLEDEYLSSIVDVHASNASTNAATHTESVGTLTGTGGTLVAIGTASVTYKGYPAAGVVSDNYTVTVTTSGDQTSARFSVASANGAFPLIQDLSITQNVGLSSNDYLIIKTGDSDANKVVINFDGTTSFSEGDTWTITGLRAAVTQAVPAGSGTYTGPVDMTYTVRVERGGLLYTGSNADTCARLVVTASDVDTSAVVLPKANVAFNVGSYGAQLTFSAGSTNGALIKGDVYTLNVTAATAGPINIVEVAEELSFANGASLTAQLFLNQNGVQVPIVRDQLTDSRNWAQTEDSVTVKSGIVTHDNTLTVGGVAVELPVDMADIFVEHRVLLSNYTSAIESITSTTDVISKLGTLHPDNTLAQGVYDALLNAAGQTVYYVAVPSNDLAGYLNAIKIAEKSETVYSFVPLTFDQDVQEAVVSHVNAYSKQEVGRWRIAWLAAEDKKTAVLFNKKDDGSNFTGTITADPVYPSDPKYRLLTVSGATFLTSGVRQNDTVRINFRLNSDGVEIYDEYVVTSVKSNTTLLIGTNLTNPINVASKVQIVRNYTRSERAANIAALAASYNDRRVRLVFPDTYKDKGVVKAGYFAAAGLAGLRSGVVPQQGLTNSQFLGATEISKVVTEFTQTDLDTMAAKGVWILAQETLNSIPYVRHQLTTSTAGVNTSEDSVTTNVDSISYALKAVLQPFVGKYNINPETVAVVRGAIAAELLNRATNTGTARAGNQLVSFNAKTDIVNVSQNSVYKDNIDAEVRLNVPYPMNYINLKLTVN
jgi:hypothetical protein